MIVHQILNWKHLGMKVSEKLQYTITKGPICSQISDGFRVEYYQQGNVGCKKRLVFKTKPQNVKLEFQVTELRTHY